RSELEDHSRADAVVDELESVLVVVALRVLEEVGDAGPHLEQRVGREGVGQRHPGIAVDLLEVDGAAVLLAPAVDLRETTTAEPGPSGEPSIHGNVEAKAHDRHWQLGPGEVFGIAMTAADRRVTGQLRREVNVRQPDAAGQEAAGHDGRALVRQTG